MNTSYLKFDSTPYPKFAVNLTTTDDEEDDDDEFMKAFATAAIKAVALPLLCHHSNINITDCANEMLKATNTCQSICALDEERYLSKACAGTTPLDGHPITCQQFLAPEYALTDECMDIDDNKDALIAASMEEKNFVGDYICQQIEMEGKDCTTELTRAVLKCTQECSKDEECTLKPFEEDAPNVTCGNLLQNTYEKKKQACDLAQLQGMTFLSYVAMASGNLISEQVHSKKSD